MRKRQCVIACIVALSILGGITSFAKGPGETKTTSTENTQVNITTYTQDSVRGLGTWEKQPDNAWKFKLLTGGYLTRSWVESLTEANAFYYVNDYGIMSVSATTPDGFTVDSTGLYRKGNTNPNNSSNPSPTETKGSGDSVERYPNGRPKVIRGIPVDEDGIDKDGNVIRTDEYLKWMESQTWGDDNYGGIN